MTQDALDAFYIALHSDKRMTVPTPRELAAGDKVQRSKFKKHMQRKAPKHTPAPAPAVTAFEPYVLTRGTKAEKCKFIYERPVPGHGKIRATFRTLEEANRFARAVNNIYRGRL